MCCVHDRLQSGDGIGARTVPGSKYILLEDIDHGASAAIHWESVEKWKEWRLASGRRGFSASQTYKCTPDAARGTPLHNSVATHSEIYQLSSFKLTLPAGFAAKERAVK